MTEEVKVPEVMEEATVENKEQLEVAEEITKKESGKVKELTKVFAGGCDELIHKGKVYYVGMEVSMKSKEFEGLERIGLKFE